MHERPELTIAFVPGVTVTKWTRTWAQRHPHGVLTVLPTDQEDQTNVVLDGTAQLSFVRLPIESDGLHVIPLYRENAVAVAGKDHLIAAVDSITLSDLEGEKRQTAGTKHHDRGPFDLVAAGVGVLVVPQSIARIQSRKDVVVRPITDAPDTQIALIWRADAGAPIREDDDAADTASARAELIADFIGIVRGRTARSSRDAPSSRDAQGSSATQGSRTAADAERSAQRPQPAKAKGATKGSAKAGGQAQRTSAAHAANRKRAESRKKHRGR